MHQICREPAASKWAVHHRQTGPLFAGWRWSILMYSKVNVLQKHGDNYHQ